MKRGSPRLPGVRHVLHLERAPSTQVLARRMAEEGAPAGTLVRADRQTRGHGRMGNRWSSGLGGLYFSLILRPGIRPAALADLSLATAAACAAALARVTRLKTAVKLPNDIFAYDKSGRPPPRKVCGILIQASGDTKKVDWMVIGVGVNVNNRVPPSLTAAASLRGLAGRSFPMEKVLMELLRDMRAKLDRRPGPCQRTA